jgi:endo-1,4-beta-xylanase
MQKLVRLLSFFLIGVLMSGVQVAFSQEERPTMRELADLIGLEIGAAVYTYHLNDERHATILASEFNVLTPEQEAKPCEVQRVRDRFDFGRADRLVDFAEEHDMRVRGHTLIWHACTPTWVTNGTFSREEAIDLLRHHIVTVMGHYEGRIRVWDVVNEGIDDDASIRETPWQQLIGDDYMELAFQFAHEADPDALLFYNDYAIEGLGGKSDAVYEMAQDFLERGIPIHGIGLQGHYTLGGINQAALRANIQRFGALGLEVHFTEVDVRFSGEPSDEILRQQAVDYRTLLGICLESEACNTFIVWGVSDRYTWLRGANLDFFSNPAVTPLLFDDNYEPKPAYFAVLDLLAREAGVSPILSDEELDTLLGREPEFTIPEPSKSDPEQLSPDSVEGRIYYAPFPVTITLDGETDDWENIPRVTIDSGTMVPPDNDTTMTFAAAADETHLYFLADVTDSNIVYGNYGAGEWYREDSVEFYLNTTENLEAASYAPGIVQIGIMAANLAEPEQPLIGGGRSADAQISFVIVETDHGYLIEAAVPLVTDVWDIEPAHLDVLGFQAHLNGSSSTDRDTKLIWSVHDTQDQSWQNPALFGQLVFWDIEP